MGNKGRLASKHEVVRIIFNLSYSPVPARALIDADVVQSVLVPAIEGRDAGHEDSVRYVYTHARILVVYLCMIMCACLHVCICACVILARTDEVIDSCIHVGH